jgi:hypothetical protein
MHVTFDQPINIPNIQESEAIKLLVVNTDKTDLFRSVLFNQLFQAFRIGGNLGGYTSREAISAGNINCSPNPPNLDDVSTRYTLLR